MHSVSDGFKGGGKGTMTPSLIIAGNTKELGFHLGISAISIFFISLIFSDNDVFKSYLKYQYWD